MVLHDQGNATLPSGLAASIISNEIVVNDTFISNEISDSVDQSMSVPTEENMANVTAISQEFRENCTQETMALQLLVFAISQLAGNLSVLENATTRLNRGILKASQGILATNQNLDGAAIFLQELFGQETWEKVEQFMDFFSTDFQVRNMLEKYLKIRGF